MKTTGRQVVSIVGLLLCALGATALWMPLRTWDPATHVVVAAADVEPDGELAYALSLPGGETLRYGNQARLRLTEDGVELAPHADPESLRRHGGARFAYSNDLLVFGTTDGSDPRTNGRRYEILRPTRAVDGRLADAALACLVLGALLGLAGGVPRSTIGRLTLVASLLAAGYGVATTRPDAWPGWLQREAARDITEMRAAAAASTQPGREESPAPADPQRSGALPPRTLRLLDADAPPAFEAHGDAPTPRPPLVLPLTCADGTPAEGLLEVALKRPLDAALPPDLFAGELDELVLRVRVLEGDQLALLFHLQGGEEELLRVPVEPTGEWTTISITQPLLMTRYPERRLTGLQFGSPAMHGKLLRFETEPLVVKREGDRFTEASHGWERLSVGGSLRPAFWQSVPGRSALPDHGLGGRLRGAVAVLGGDARVAVGGTAFERTLTPDDGWLELDIPIAAGDTLTLDVNSLAPGATVAWSALRRVDDTRPPRRVVLILMDTLRADALGCYGNADAATPALDTLAAEGVLFERCYSQSHWTRPSMTSIMSGRYVTATGVQAPGSKLPETYETLAEAFGAAGFHTLAFLTNTNAGPAAGLEQGFDEVVLKRTQWAREVLHEMAWPRARVLDVDDVFLYVHLMDAHGPYGPPKRPDGWVDPPGAPVEPRAELDPRWMESPTVASRRALYAHDVASMDVQLGRFLDEVTSTWEVGEPDDVPPVIVAALSDHGELLGEIGRWGHGRFLQVPQLTNVPLILRAPGLLPAGTRWPHVVENRSVGATLLELAGVDPPAAFGPSLLPRVLGETDAAGPGLAISSDERFRTGLFSVQGPDGGLIGQGGELIERTDAGHRWLGAPPLATLAELGASPDEAFAEFWRAFLERHDAERQWLWAAASEGATALDAAQLEQLRELGYLGY